VERHISSVTRLRASLDALGEQVEGFDFDLPSAHRAHRIELRDEIVLSIRGYLIPRLGDLDGEIVAVVVGSTGSGKSTLVNTLAGEMISPTSAVRPTTTVPVVWCHPDHADSYRSHPLGGVRPVVVAGHDPMLRGVTLVDAPDFDSVVIEHREIAEDLLAIADLCVFVTSAQRYADAVPWDFLQRATRRGVPILFVINRLPSSGRSGIVDDYVGHLVQRSIVGDDRLLVEIEEQTVVDGTLPSVNVAHLRDVLQRFAEPSRRHEVLIDATRGTVTDVISRSHELASEVRLDNREATSLVDIARDAYADGYEKVAAALKEGSLIREEVAARWQKYLGTGGFLKSVTDRIGSLGGFFGERQVDPDARRAFASVVERHLDAAATRAAAAWELDHAGKVLLEEGRLWRSDPGVAARLEDVLDEWVVDVGTLVSDEGQGKKRRAQLGSLGVNAAAVVAMVAIFSQTGGLTGGELGVAAGAAALQQKLLEQAFGTAAVRSMVATARRSLLDRLRAVFDQEASRFSGRVERLATGSDLGLRHATDAVQDAAERFYGS
jgi:hypothetical protein